MKLARILGKYTDGVTMTSNECVAIAQAGSYKYLGVSMGVWCYYDSQSDSYNCIGFVIIDDMW